jgi:protein-tyrosine phosphatase
MKVEIIPDLWLGNDQSALNTQDDNFVYINCSNDLSFLGRAQQYNIEIKNNLEKYEILKMYQYLNETVEFIYKNLINLKPVLVHCETGTQKSATVVAAYLIKYGKINIEQAVKLIKTKKIDCFTPDIDYFFSLEKYYKNL